MTPIALYGICYPKPRTLNPEQGKTEPNPYLEGQGDLVSRLVTPITHIITIVIPIILLLIKSP